MRGYSFSFPRTSVVSMLALWFAADEECSSSDSRWLKMAVDAGPDISPDISPDTQYFAGMSRSILRQFLPNEESTLPRKVRKRSVLAGIHGSGTLILNDFELALARSVHCHVCNSHNEHLALVEKASFGSFNERFSQIAGVSKATCLQNRHIWPRRRAKDGDGR